MFSTDGDPPHGVRPAGSLWLQDPGLAVDLVQDVPECGEGLQDQQELVVELLQSRLMINRNRTDFGRRANS